MRFYNPVEIIEKPFEQAIESLPKGNTLLVTSPGFKQRDHFKRLKHYLRSNRSIMVWDRVFPNPDFIALNETTNELRNHHFEQIIGLGGGSTLDTAKILSILLHHKNDMSLQSVLVDRMLDEIYKARLHLILIPTTAGTGAEVTPFATVWDSLGGGKYSVESNLLFADKVILDHTLLPKEGESALLYPALDALSHCFESLWNKNKSPVSISLATAALPLVLNALPCLGRTFQDPVLRRDLQRGSLLAGLAISQTQTAVAHSISYPLTARYGVPHGLACSFALPVILRINPEINPFPNEDISKKILSIYRDLGVGEKLAHYVDRNKIFLVEDQMSSSNRFLNYCGNNLPTISEIIDQSLWGLND